MLEFISGEALSRRNEDLYQDPIQCGW